MDSWRKAHQVALDVYRATDALPPNEVFGISVQLRRSAIAIPTRIAEGCGRDDDSGFGATLQKARANCTELEYLLLLCRDLKYLPVAVHDKLSGDVVEVRKMLSGHLRWL